MARVVIIGAGLTGLSAAYHLEKKGFYDYVLIEKNKTIGGLCSSVMQDGFIFDYTGHLLHINDPYFKQFIEELIGFDFFNQIKRKAHIYSHQQLTHYPYQVNLHGLPHQVIIDCIEGFVHRDSKKKIKSFHDWVLVQFGAGFARHFFIPYQEKIFSCDIDSITASWTSRFVPTTTLTDILKGTLQKPKDSIGYNANFYYPKKGGIVSWLYPIAQALKRKVITDSRVLQVDTIQKVITLHDGHKEPYEYIINTMPLDMFLNQLVEKPTLDCKKAVKKLKCASVFNFNIGLQKASIADSHWIYYPEKKYPFYRIGFPSNLSSEMAPNGCSSLSGEISFMQKPYAYLYDLYKTAQLQLKKQLDFSHADMITESLITIPHAYVIFDFWREKNLAKILKRLEQERIYSIGRYGAWKYSSMQEAVLDGKSIADCITVMPAKRWYDIPLLNHKIKQKEYV